MPVVAHGTASDYLDSISAGVGILRVVNVITG